MSDFNAAADAGGRPRRTGGGARKLFDLAKEPSSYKGAAARSSALASSRPAARSSSAAAAEDRGRPPSPRPAVDVADDVVRGRETSPSSNESRSDAEAFAPPGQNDPPSHTSPVVVALTALVRQQQDAIDDIRNVSLEAQSRLRSALASNPPSDASGGG